MKNTIILFIIITNIIYGWEINTHRAIDKTAIGKATNLTDFAKDANIKSISYQGSKFRDYDTTYFNYVTYGEEDGVSKGIWRQTFDTKIPSYQNLIEAGTILEDVVWDGADWIAAGGDGRFSNHFYDPQNYGKSLTIGYEQNVDAITWATTGATLGVSPTDKRSNYYSLDSAREYMRLGFTESGKDDRKNYQAKMFVAVGHILHLMNDMNVPAHTRDDAHPNGDALEVWMRGGEKADETTGYRVIGSSLNNNDSKVTTRASSATPYKYNNYKEGTLRFYMGKEAKFTGTHFFSSPYRITAIDSIGTIEQKNYRPTPDETTLSEEIDLGRGIKKQYIQSKLLSEHNKLGIVINSFITKKMMALHSGNFKIYNRIIKIDADYSVLQDNGYHLIPRAVSNASGFVNYFFRGKMQATGINSCSITITNNSNASLVADNSVVTFAQGGTIDIFYDDKDGNRESIFGLHGAYTLENNLSVGASVTIPLQLTQEILDKMGDNKKLTIVYDGKIGSETGVSVLVVELPEDVSQSKGTKGIVEVLVEWDKPQVDYDLIVGWTAMKMDINDIGCPIEHGFIKSDRSIKPGVYPVYLRPKNTQENLKKFDDLNLYPIKANLTIKILGTSYPIELTIKEKATIDPRHVADINVSLPKKKNWNDGGGDDNDSEEKSGSSAIIVTPTIFKACPSITSTPSVSPSPPIYYHYNNNGGTSYWSYGNSGAISYGGGVSSDTSSGTTSGGGVVSNSPSCSGNTECINPPSDSDTPSDTAQDNNYAHNLPKVGGKVTYRDVNKKTCDEDVTVACMPYLYEVVFYYNKVYFGPLRNANLALYTLSEYRQGGVALYEGTTSDGDNLHDAGNIDLSQEIMESLDDEKLYIFKVTGGEDIDHNDDYTIDTTPTINQGEIYTVASGKDIKNGGIKVNILTTITFELIKEMILDENISKQAIETKIKDIASRLLKYKLYSNTTDTPISNADLLAWLPTVDKDVLLQSYNPLKVMVDKLFRGEDIYKDAYNYVYFIEDNTIDNNVTDSNNSDNNAVKSSPIIRSFSKSIAEDAQGGTVVGQVEVLRGEDITFTGLSGQGSEDFEINSDGVIKLKEGINLDYETRWLYKLSTMASNSDDGLSASVGVYISVKNIVDAPEYKSFSGGYVDEDAIDGTIVAKVNFDQGASPIESIRLIGTSTELFTVDLNGTIALAPNALLDYENKYNYGFFVIATNAYGDSLPVIVYINVKNIPDIAKVTQTTNISISENASIGSVVGSVIVDKGGSEIVDIHLEGDSASEYFSIDTNGTIHTIAPLDFESKFVFMPEVVVTNAHGTIKKQIFISVDNVLDVPEFVGFSGGNINESSPIGTAVAKIDFAGNVESITLVGDDGESFRIAKSGEITTAVNNLNYEEKWHYKFDVIATNTLGDSLPVEVNIVVDDIDETKAIMDDTNLSIEENSSVSTLVGKINIKDEGTGGIEAFELLGDNSSDFIIDNFGNIKVNKKLDYETTYNYALQVRAKNSAGWSPKYSLYIALLDIPDVVATLERVNFEIDENITSGSVIGSVKVISQGDSRISTFRVENSDKIIIDNNGTIRVNGDKRFDYESKTQHYFTIVASNLAGDSSDMCYIKVNNVPDTPPVLSNQSFSVDENSKGIIVGKIVNIVTDSPIEFFEISGDGSENFSIDRNGTLSTTTDANLDYESITNYQLNIRTKNSTGYSNSAWLSINVRNLIDDEPVLGVNKDINISENLSVGRVVGKINIGSNGSLLINNIKLDGANANHFKIESNGSIVIASKLDYEFYPNYNLQAQAQNLKAYSNVAQLKINLIDAADAPVITLSENTIYVDENATIGTTIGSVETLESGGVADNFIINASHLYDGKFNIDKNGSIKVVKELDYEDVAYYSFHIEANNNIGISNRILLNIYLNDITTKPIIKGFTTTVKSNIGKDQFIENLTIIDNGDSYLEYKLIGEGSENFYIDRGVISTTKNHNIQVQKYNLQAIATNTAGIESDPVEVVINVVSEPIIEGFSVNIDENISKGTLIGQVKVLSHGESNITSFEIFYYKSDFVIDKDGYVYVSQYNSIDFEYRQHYELEIVAKNSVATSESVKVDINVVDLGTIPKIDNKHIELTSNPKANLLIGQLSIDDGDSVISTVTLEGDGNENFIVDNKGTVHIKKDMEHSNQEYNLSVTATNKFGVSQVATLTIKIIKPEKRKFITKWRTGSNNIIYIKTHPNYLYNYTIDWGDLNVEHNRSGDASHRYQSAGSYIVTISGQFPALYFSQYNSSCTLNSIEQWGDNEWLSMQNAFAGCVRIIINAMDTPDLSKVTNMSYMFAEVDTIEGNITGWDVSNVKNMEGLFYRAYNFNQDIGDWNVSNVTNMSHMFYSYINFNQDIGRWDVSSVTDMSYMFADTSYYYNGFSHDLGDWNVSNVTNMEGMFYGTYRFNHDLSRWNISNVTNMSDMFLSYEQSDDYAPMSMQNYDKMLNSWSKLNLQPNVSLGIYPTQYSIDGKNAKEYIVNTFNWIISDEGMAE